MKLIIIVFTFFSCFFSCFSQDSISPILIDKSIISGEGLEKISPYWAAPERELFTKNAFNGEELGVNITSSSNAYHDWENYVIDEFVFVLNGQAHVNSTTSPELTLGKGSFFIVPKGFTGRWTTKGNKGNFLELAIYNQKRKDRDSTLQIQPIEIDASELSGMDAIEDEYIFIGSELVVRSYEAKVDTEHTINNKKDQLIYILNGQAVLKDSFGKTYVFHSGDFYVIPKGFAGIISYKGFDLYRALIVEASN